MRISNATPRGERLLVVGEALILDASPLNVAVAVAVARLGGHDRRNSLRDRRSGERRRRSTAPVVTRAVMIDGTSLFGGLGTITRTASGAPLFAKIDNGLALSNVPALYLNIIVGSILILAVAAEYARRQRFYAAYEHLRGSRGCSGRGRDPSQQPDTESRSGRHPPPGAGADMTRPVHAVDYDRRKVRAGILHFGVGNFHRSHQAMYIDRLLSDPKTFDATAEWGICGVGVLASDIAMRDALRSQNYEYTLVERRPDGTAPARQIGSIVDYVYAPDELGVVLDRLAHPDTRIVSLTITEGGYNISDVTGEFDTANPAVVADLQAARPPTTVFGIIVAGLQKRRANGVAPFTIISCDNIEANGDVARRSFVSFAALVDPELATWIAESVSFPNSMVDRITPVTTDEDRDWVRQEYGVDDAWPVLSEDYAQWVLEDDFALGRPPLEHAGVQLVDDVRPYELMKLRLLNGTHQALAYAGILSGYQFAHDAAADPVISGMLRAYMDTEVTPTLDPVPGIDLDAYKDSLLARFGNFYVRDTLERLATDASDRIPKFLLPVIRDRRLHGESTPIAAAVIAAWARYAELYVLGEPVPFRDQHEHAVRDAVARQARDPVGFLENGDWFGALAADAGFTRDFSHALTAFRHTADPRPAIAEITTRSLQARSAW